MKKFLALAIVAGVTAGALAEKKALNAVKFDGERNKVTMSEGGAAGSPMPIYDWRGGSYYFYCGSATSVCAIEVAEEQLGRNLGPGHSGSGGVPYGAFIYEMFYGAVTVQAATYVTDSLHVWYDTIDFDGSPAGESALKDPILAVGVTGITLPDTTAGATGWIITVDISGFGGVPVTNQLWGYSQGYYTAGGTFTSLHPGVTHLWGGKGWDDDGDGTWDRGESGDFFFMDVDGDGSYEVTEAYWFGGGGFFTANLYVRWQACVPCDTDCNGTLNAFDIQGFLDVLGGSAGCSPCSSDANVDGTANAFDINAFLACIS